MRWLWLVVVLAACSGDDGTTGDAGNVTWSWTFIDPATRAEVPCPANSMTISVWDFAGGGESGSGYKRIASLSFICDEGKGVFTLPVGSHQLVLEPSVDGHPYAEVSATVKVEDGKHAEGHTDITASRGIPHVTWTVTSTSTMTTTACPNGDSTIVVDTTLELHDTYPCGLENAWLPGQEAGVHTIQLFLGHMYPGGVVPVAQAQVDAEIVADAVTEVPVTFTVP